VGFAAVLVRLYASQLFRVYRFFWAYALFEAVRMIVSMMIPYRSNAFAHFFFACEPIVWMLSALAILEVYGIVLRNHPGIATLGRQALMGSIGASIVLSLCTLFLDFQNVEVKYPILANFFLLSRLVMVSLLFFVVFITAFMVWFPITLTRNIVVHCSVSPRTSWSNRQVSRARVATRIGYESCERRTTPAHHRLLRIVGGGLEPARREDRDKGCQVLEPGAGEKADGSIGCDQQNPGPLGQGLEEAGLILPVLHLFGEKRFAAKSILS